MKCGCYFVIDFLKNTRKIMEIYDVDGATIQMNGRQKIQVLLNITIFVYKTQWTIQFA
jgi:hypothetical protein